MKPLTKILLTVAVIASFGANAAMAQVINASRLTSYADTVRLGGTRPELVRLSGQVWMITQVTPPNPIVPA